MKTKFIYILVVLMTFSYQVNAYKIRHIKGRHSNETHELTKKVYVSAEEGENLRYRYSYKHFETVRSQLQIGGIRLAKVLNDLF